jgi:DNA-binding MarR family transcriptional regulator
MISLMADAEKRLPKMRAILFAGHEDALSGLGDDEVAQLAELLERVTRR